MLNLSKDSFPTTKVTLSETALFIRKLIKDLVKERFSSSFKIYILDSGSCNGCELELQLLFSPLYDLSSYGVSVVYDITKADALLVTGLMTENMYAELNALSKQFKMPQEVILVGDCPLQATAFQESFALKGEVTKLFPNAFEIKGCPPEPLLLLDGLYRFLEKL